MRCEIGEAIWKRGGNNKFLLKVDILTCTDPLDDPLPRLCPSVHSLRARSSMGSRCRSRTSTSSFCKRRCCRCTSPRGWPCTTTNSRTGERRASFSSYSSYVASRERFVWSGVAFIFAKVVNEPFTVDCPLDEFSPAPAPTALPSLWKRTPSWPRWSSAACSSSGRRPTRRRSSSF